VFSYWEIVYRYQENTTMALFSMKIVCNKERDLGFHTDPGDILIS